MSKKLTYKYVKEYIESFDYKLLSKEYIGAHNKLKIQCPESHKFYMTWANFKRGNRCKQCNDGKQKHSYEYVKEYIESFDYKLLSKEYINSNEKIKIKCTKGHEFLIRYKNFQQGVRCPVCAGNKKHSYEYVKSYIESFDYKLLSKEYTGALDKMKLQCPEGHEFPIAWTKFQQGRRCPQCDRIKTASKAEKEVNEYVKSLTNKLILENDRTQIINSLTGHNLELDIYIPSLNKAIEYNGDYWHCNPDIYEADYWHIQMKLHAYQIWSQDRKKIELCKEKGIDVLVIWEYDWNNKQEQCMELIKQHIKS